MRIAIVSDIHANQTAFQAVLADLRQTSPDLIFHGGDLCHGGSGPAEILDHIRDLGWPGVLGNTDEVLFRPESLTDFAAQTPPMQPMLQAITDIVAATLEALGEPRIAWLRTLPLVQKHAPLALVHASPGDCWRSPGPQATDAELVSAYQPLESPIVVYGHIHQSFIRNLSHMTVANSGSVSLSYDGDPRAAYLLLDDSRLTIRRVVYDVEKEIRAFTERRFPYLDWFARMLRSARPQMP